jgi:hypothetical protein
MINAGQILVWKPQKKREELRTENLEILIINLNFDVKL